MFVLVWSGQVCQVLALFGCVFDRSNECGAISPPGEVEMSSIGPGVCGQRRRRIVVDAEM